MLQRFLSVFLILTLFILPAEANTEQSPAIHIDGYEKAFDQGPAFVNGIIMLPVRGVFESAGAEVRWNETTRTVTIVKGNTTINIPIGRNLIKVNHITFKLNQDVKIINGRAMAEPKLFSQTLGIKMEFNKVENIVYLYSSNGMKLFAYAEQNDVKKIKSLLDNGENVNVENDAGWTPLMSAVFHHNLEAVNALINGGAEVNVKTNDGFTPLTWAARYGNNEILNSLLDAGANPDVTNHLGWSALMYASYMGNQSMAESLISSGATVNYSNGDNDSALSLARIRGYQNIIELLQENLD